MFLRGIVIKFLISLCISTEIRVKCPGSIWPSPDQYC